MTLSLTAAGVLLAYVGLRAQMLERSIQRESSTPCRSTCGSVAYLAALLLYCSFYFYRYAFRRNSVAFPPLAFSLALWAAPMERDRCANLS